MSIEIKGIEQLSKKLENMAKQSTIEKSIEDACLTVERAAKEKAPVKSGELRRSITSKVEKSSNGYEGTIYTPLEYAPYVEYGTGLFAEKGGRKDVPWVYQGDDGEWHGTKGQKPQPFMRPALNENKDKIIREIKEGILK